GQVFQPAQVLHDRHVAAQQGRVNGTSTIANVVDVVTVDPDQGNPRGGEVRRGRARDEGVALEVAVGAPGPRPAGADQHRLAAQVQAAQVGGGERRLAVGERDDEPLQVGERLQGQFRQVLAGGEAVEGAVEVGAGVGHHLDLADLELGARRVQGP